MWHGAENVCHGAKKVQHGGKNVPHGVKTVRHGDKNVWHGVKNVRHVLGRFYHGVQWTSGLIGLGDQGTIYGDKTTKKHTHKQTHRHINTMTRPGLRAGPSENTVWGKQVDLANGL